MPSLFATGGRSDTCHGPPDEDVRFACPHCGRHVICVDVACGILSTLYRLTSEEAHRTLEHSAQRAGTTAHAVAQDVIDAAAVGRPVALP
jgi:hypothetical protein